VVQALKLGLELWISKRQRPFW